MARLSSFALPGVLLAAAAGALACGSDGGTAPAPRTGILFIAGDSGTDTVTAPRLQALVVEVRDSTGRPQPRVNVQFLVGAPTDSTRGNARGLALCSTASTTCSSTNAFTTGARTEPTNDVGRASVVVHHGTVAGPAWLHVYVPELGLRDSVQFTTRPGQLAALRPSVSDTVIVLGSSFAVTLTGRDRFENSRGAVAGATLSGGGEILQLQANTVRGVAIGQSFVLHSAGAIRETTSVTVVPSGQLAMTRGNAIVVANFDGTGVRTYTGVSVANQYGLRPNWASGGTRILVNGSGTDGIRLRSIDVATGSVSTLPTTAAIAGQYYPDATQNWIYFNAEMAGGGYRTWRMRPDGSALAQAPGTVPSYPNYYRPALSPDSSKVVVSVIEGTVGVRVFDAVTGVAISPFMGNATSPRWSPDGQSVAYSTPGGGALRVMRADGSQARVVSTQYFGEWFDWSNDGQWLVAQLAGRLVLLRVSDATVVPLGFTGDAWQPAVQR